VRAAEERLRAFARELFDRVDMLAAAVVAPSAYLFVSTVPIAAMTSREAWFSEAISSSCDSCRSRSASIAVHTAASW